MKTRLLLAFGMVIFVGLLVWRAEKQSPPAPVALGSPGTSTVPENHPTTTTSAVNAMSITLPASTLNSSPSTAAVVSATPVTTMAANHLQPGMSASSVEEISPAVAAILMENLRTTVRHYGLRFGGNPVGTNQEITKALNGGNPKHVEFLGPDGNTINDKGELVDAWGTPYFFHQLSGQVMEIRSAGPDKRMWTDDDLVIR